MNLSPQILYDEHEFQLVFKLPNAGYVEKLIKYVPPNILTLKSDNYMLTDQKTQLKYLVTNQKEYITFSFQKSKLINYDLNALVCSFQQRIQFQNADTEKLLNHIEKINFSIVREIEYSPTEITFELVYGKMMVVRFQISSFISNSVSKRSQISIVSNHLISNTNIRNPNCFRYPVINLGLAHIYRIDQFIDFHHRTYIPMQILTQKLSDPSLISQLYQYMLTIHPTKQLVTLVFVENSERISLWLGSDPFIISLHSYFRNDKLVIDLDQGTIFCLIQGQNRRCDPQYFITHIKEVIKKWEFENLNEIDEFFQKFLLHAFAYFLLYSCKDKFFRMATRLHQDKYEKALKSVLQKVAIFYVHNMGRSLENRDLFTAKKILQTILQSFSEKLTVLHELLYTQDQKGNQYLEIIQLFLEKLEKRQQELLRSQFREEDLTNFVNRLNIFQFKQYNDEIVFRERKYLFYPQQRKIAKVEKDQIVETWNNYQLPECEMKLIRDEI